ncbi:MAG: hypothetical protein KJS92_05610 [Bacteroidetes bacterium]|nr:hypothetical protein [Bacteroidota bacterium]
MKKNRLLLFSLLQFSMLGAQQVTKDFPKLQWDEDFNLANEKWPQTYNSDNFFLVQNGSFDMQRTNTKTGTFVFPSEDKTFGYFEVRSRLVFREGPGTQRVAGLVIQAQADGSGALVIELNDKYQYRVRRMTRDGSVNLTGGGENEGWIKAKRFLNKDGNTIVVKTYEKVYDLYLNDQYAITFTEIELSQGKIGFYVGPGTKVSAEYVKVMGDENFTMVSSDVQNQAAESLTLQQIIVRLKETINKKDKRIAELEAEVRRLGSGRGNDTLTQRKLQEADKRNFELVRQIDKYRTDLDATKAKTAELEQFRNQIRENENGDIVINLTNINTRQRQQLEKLEQVKRQLESESTELKAERLRLIQENERFRMSGFEKDEEIRLLKRRLAVKDSMLQDLFQRGNNVYSEKPKETVQRQEEPPKPDRKKRKEETGPDQSEQLSADEIRRLQEQERGTPGKPSDPLPSGKLPKPKKEKKVKKEKVIIPETIIID